MNIKHCVIGTALSLLTVGCAQLMSHAYGKRFAAAQANADSCFEEEYTATETPPTDKGFWWVACKDRVWKCRGRGLYAPPECHPDSDYTAQTLP